MLANRFPTPWRFCWAQILSFTKNSRLSVTLTVQLMHDDFKLSTQYKNNVHISYALRLSVKTLQLKAGIDIWLTFFGFLLQSWALAPPTQLDICQCSSNISHHLSLSDTNITNKSSHISVKAVSLTPKIIPIARISLREELKGGMGSQDFYL